MARRRLRLGVVALCVVTIGCSGDDEDASERTRATAEATTTTVDPDVAAIAQGYVAVCNDGGYSDNEDFTATCSGGNGIARWLAPFGECEDGTVIAMDEDSSCRDHDGFRSALAPNFEPTPRPQDIALCKNGLYSDNRDLGDTCSSNDGVDKWLAQYGQCDDGTIIQMSDGPSCSGHGGFDSLLPDGFEPQSTTSASQTTRPPSTSRAPSPTTLAPAVPLPSETLSFIDVDACVQDPDEWWRCTRGSESLFVTERSDPVAVFAEVQGRADFNASAATLFSIDGGGILYLPSNAGFEMFDVAPWPGLHVIDTDCIGVPADPSLC